MEVVSWSGSFTAPAPHTKGSLGYWRVRDSEKDSKTSHLASRGKDMHKTLGVENRIPTGVLQPLAVSRQTETLKI
jgi:hypothetical protein